MDKTFDIATQLGTVSTAITDSMDTVAVKAVGLVASATPYIIGVVAVIVVLGFGVKLVKKIRG